MSRSLRIFTSVLFGIPLLVLNLSGQSTSQADQRSLSIVFNDGRRQSIPLDDIARIEFDSGPVVVLKNGRRQSIPAASVTRIEFNSSNIKSSSFGRNNFLGKWEVGVGVGSGTFFITLDPNGEAHKTLGSSHGSWAFVDGEARISWDDGWHDAIRKVGTKHEKFAYSPGKTFSDEPSNVTDAKNTTAQPI